MKKVNRVSDRVRNAYYIKSMYFTITEDGRAIH
jgi:hypothetical protein